MKRFLAAGANVKHQNRDGSTSLTWASEKGHVNVVTELIKSGANVNHQYKNGNTALMFASYRGHFSVVVELLKAPGIQLELYDRHDDTALSSAKKRGHAGIARLLEEAGATR